ncbi:hypothetical protein Tco_0865934 [Tanacetum coccineum]
MRSRPNVRRSEATRGTFPMFGEHVSLKVIRSDDKFSQMLTQLESQPEIGGGSGSDGRGDDEQGDDEDDGKTG